MKIAIKLRKDYCLMEYINIGLIVLCIIGALIIPYDIRNELLYSAIIIWIFFNFLNSIVIETDYKGDVY